MTDPKPYVDEALLPVVANQGLRDQTTRAMKRYAAALLREALRALEDVGCEPGCLEFGREDADEDHHKLCNQRRRVIANLRAQLEGEDTE